MQSDEDLPKNQTPNNTSMPEPTVIQPSQPTVPPSATPSEPTDLQPNLPQQPMSPLQMAEAPTTPNGFGTSPSTPPGPAPMITSARSAKLPSGRKRLFALAGSGLAIMLLIGGFVFGYYLPNRPQAVWNTGLDRSGKALAELVAKATEAKTLEAVEKSKTTLSIEAKQGDKSYGGTFTGRFDKQRGDGTLVLTAKDGTNADKVLNAKFMSDLKEGAKFPVGYFQVNGLASFGLDGLATGTSSIEGRWIKIDESFFQDLGITPEQIADQQSKQITSEDIASASRSIVDVLAKHVLTSDPENAIFEQKQYVGKEKVDGVSAFHYVVGINKAKAKDFCAALVEAGTSTEIYKKLAGDTPTDDEKSSVVKSCQDSVDNDIKDDDTFDLWVDAKYKLIHKVRLTDREDKESYTDIGQNYKGGDKISLFTRTHDAKGKNDTNFILETDIRTHKTSGSFTFEQTGETDNWSVRVTLTAEPHNETIEFTEPSNAIPLQDLLGGFFGGTGRSSSRSNTGGSISARAQDTERQTDIKALHAQLEAYYAQNGHYPSRSNVNSSTFRKQNLRGLNEEALKDPKGSGFILASSPAPNIYAYSVTTAPGKSCESNPTSCAKYTLTATLSDGSTYRRSALN